MAHAEGPPRAGWSGVVPGSSLRTCRAPWKVCACVCMMFHRVGRGAWAFEVRGRHVGAWSVRGKRCIGYSWECYLYKRPLRYASTVSFDFRISYLRPISTCFTRQLPISYSSNGEAAQAFTRTRRARAGCVCAGRGRRLRLLELSRRRWRARARALAMSSSSPYAMAARRASRGCTAVVAACRACGAADEACAVKMVLEASEVAHSVAYSSAET